MNVQAVRISKYFTDCGVLSRRAADEAIKKGRVTVNGMPAVLGQMIVPGTDTVTLDGKKVMPPRNAGRICVMLNKPRGYVTTASDEKGRKTVMDLVSGIGVRLYPVGRLDMNSEGLILLTNDGDLANRLMHPSSSHTKVYHVTVDGEVTSEQLQKLSSPLEIEGKMTRPAVVTVVGEHDGRTVLSFSVNEGRNRQLRRLCEAANLTVLRLVRISIGGLSLDYLPVGKWKKLTDEQIDLLLGVRRGPAGS